MNKIWLFLLVFSVVVLVGCTAVTQSATQETTGTTEATTAGTDSGRTDSGESESVQEDEFEMDESVKKKVKANPDLEDSIMTLRDGTKYLLNPKKILSGGPPKDGIPSIDNPKFETAEEADKWLKDDDLILGLNFNGAIKAYPHRILNWHEIVNDVAGGEKVLITYCPLCRTGIAFKPIVNDQEIEFGTSGKLYNSELIMYDRLTDSYWPQSLGMAVVGPSTGKILDKVALDTVRWKDWKKVHPDTEVLSRTTGFIRDYNRNPYGGIQKSDRVSFPLSNEDSRLKPKVIVYGAEFDGIAKAYAEDDVKQEKLINDAVSGIPIVVVWDPDLNVVKIFERSFEGETLQFNIDNNEIKDQNGNTWTVQEMADKLEIVDTFGHFWFAWAAFFPETDLYET